MTERIGVYIDGYNVYYGMDRKGWRRLLWLDYRRLFEAQLQGDQEIVLAKYFTALSSKPESQRRQRTYINALKAEGGLEVFEGRIDRRDVKCKQCNQRWPRYQEKETTY